MSVLPPTTRERRLLTQSALLQGPPRPERPAWPSRRNWALESARVLTLGQRSRWPPIVAVLRIAERERILSRFGAGGWERVQGAVAGVLQGQLAHHELLGLDGTDGIVLFLRGTPERQAGRRLSQMSARVSRAVLEVGEEKLQTTPICGWTTGATSPGGPPPLELLERAAEAAEFAGTHLDLLPRQWRPRETVEPPQRLIPDPWRTGLQALFTFALGAGAPFAALAGLYLLGLDLATPAYLAVTVALVITSVFIWMEGLHALNPTPLPDDPGKHPPASAVIAAYLPNEAGTILATLDAFLAQDYPGPLQVVLAYNTPHPMPEIESELRALAARDDRLLVLKVPGSTSKAQNINAALQVVTGEFTGLFDADHHPQQDAYRRAWRRLADGADVVQGHCVIRNGENSLVSRNVAVEFEAIYGVSHTGRAKLHQFGLFGGSNGFWTTSVLREVRMHGHMLTEDIDSSFRALLDGRKLVYDPALLSRELAPATMGALWNQRMRWAQGWFQVSRKHLVRALRSPELSRRNKLGIAFLLGWREAYPWLSLQMMPVLAFLIWRSGGAERLDWVIPTFLLTSLYTLSAGPATVLFAWRLAPPELRRRRAWFVMYACVSALIYTELKNLISRVAHIKELSGERQWIVTPRQP
ncbi:glycosyltransferase [Streptomyces boninensis]|uniref:glycosyltransferase n=1 Tax=Streptomyces boninensis TaxID=2039455 RepID=UPI003B219557